jgi:hypothetical protein
VERLAAAVGFPFQAFHSSKLLPIPRLCSTAHAGNEGGGGQLDISWHWGRERGETDFEHGYLPDQHHPLGMARRPQMKKLDTINRAEN